MAAANLTTKIPFRSLIKAVMVVSAIPMLVLAALVFFGALELTYFFYAYLGIVGLSVFFVRPYLANISTLADYVNNLAQDKRVEAPDLSVLSTVEELSEAVNKLHRSWETKRQQLETIITEREILVDALPDVLIMIGDDQRILRTNRSARAIFGQNLAGKPLARVIENPQFLQTIQEVIEDLRGRVVEFYLPPPIDRDFRAILERYPVPTAGGISTIVTLNDITELRRAEKMRADFVANASHEIRTPLTSIIGFIETLQGPAADDVEARLQFLKIMAEQAGRMGRLVSDLLSLSKIEMNAHTEPTGRVDMLAVIRNEARQFEWGAREKNMRITLELPAGLPPVRGDEGELAQVVHNLLGNAIKYGNPGGEITVTARLSDALPPEPCFRYIKRAIAIAVRDQGEGIPREHIPRLTERFYRVDTARTRTIGGTGLGLAIVKHILTRHKGTLTIDSVVGEGSVFTIYLPPEGADNARSAA